MQMQKLMRNKVGSDANIPIAIVIDVDSHGEPLALVITGQRQKRWRSLRDAHRIRCVSCICVGRATRVRLRVTADRHIVYVITKTTPSGV